MVTLEEIARKLTREGLPTQNQFSNGDTGWIMGDVGSGSMIVYPTQVKVVGYNALKKSYIVVEIDTEALDGQSTGKRFTVKYDKVYRERPKFDES